MPRPGEELLAEVCREWDTFKAGSLQTAEQQAAREWLIHHTASQLTLVQVLAGAFQPGIGRFARASEAASDKLATPGAEPRTTAAAVSSQEDSMANMVMGS
jgi:hypothetical protein